MDSIVFYVEKKKYIPVYYFVYSCIIVLFQNSSLCCKMNKETHGILYWQVPHTVKDFISAQSVIRITQAKVLCNGMYVMSVELNLSSGVTCVIVASVTTITSKPISFCMRDIQVFNKIINSFTDYNNSDCTIVSVMAFTFCHIIVFALYIHYRAPSLITVSWC